MQPSTETRPLDEMVLLDWHALSPIEPKKFHSFMRDYVDTLIAIRDNHPDAEEKKRAMIKRVENPALKVEMSASFTSEMAKYNGLAWICLKFSFPIKSIADNGEVYFSNGIIDENGKVYAEPIEIPIFQGGDPYGNNPFNQVVFEGKSKGIVYCLNFGGGSIIHNRGAPIIPAPEASKHWPSRHWVEPNYVFIPEEFDGLVKTVRVNYAYNKIFSADIRLDAELL